MNAKPSVRIGFLYPGHSAEDDYPRMAGMITPAVDVEVVHTTISEDAHRVDAIHETAGMHRLGPGAEALRERGVQAAMWACTCASFAFGLEGAKRQAEAIGALTGVPTSSTSLAFVAALQHLGIERVSIAASYPQDVAELFKILLAEAGVQVVHLGSRGIIAAADVALLTKGGTLGMIRDNDHAEAQAILVPDTALHTAGLVDDLEEAVNGKIVLTANQVTMWHALRLAGVQQPKAQTGLGSLFRPKR
jgi:maleate cis-trans isomerase